MSGAAAHHGHPASAKLASHSPFCISAPSSAGEGENLHPTSSPRVTGQCGEGTYKGHSLLQRSLYLNYGKMEKTENSRSEANVTCQKKPTKFIERMNTQKMSSSCVTLEL